MKTTNDKNQSRRDNGAGTIVKRSDGRWQGAAQMGYKPDGSPNRIYVYGKTEAEAKRKLKAKLKDFTKYGGITVANQAVSTWFTDWLNGTMKTGLKPRSFESKERAIEKFIIPSLGGMKVSEVTARDVQKLINEMSENGYSLSQIQKVYNTIGQRYKQGMLDGEVVFNPAAGAKLPADKRAEENSKRVKYLSDDEVKSLKKRLSQCYPNGTPIYPRGDFLIVLLYTGMRIGEALALTWNDIDFENLTITVNKTVVQLKNKDETKINPATQKPYKNIQVLQMSTKSQSSTRTIPINQTCLNALKNIQAYNGKHKWVFANSQGNWENNSNLNRMLRNALKQAQIKESYSVHCLRHTFATQLFKKGVDIKIISKVLGHSSVSITYDIYVHVIKEQEIQALNKLDTFDF